MTRPCRAEPPILSDQNLIARGQGLKEGHLLVVDRLWSVIKQRKLTGQLGLAGAPFVSAQGNVLQN